MVPPHTVGKSAYIKLRNTKELNKNAGWQFWKATIQIVGQMYSFFLAWTAQGNGTYVDNDEALLCKDATFAQTTYAGTAQNP